MKNYVNAVVLDMEDVKHPNIEQLARHDAIFLPSGYEQTIPLNIQLLYVPLRNVYKYEV